MTQRTHRVLLPLLALAAILPMCLTGPSCGHDFDFHLLSWLEASTQFAHHGYPVWTFTPAWNAGEPRFLFYPPLSWTLGALLGLLGPGLLQLLPRAVAAHSDQAWNAVPIAFTWVCLALAGLTMHRFLRRYATPAASLLAAAFYLLNPYMLFTAYERTAYGELLAAAWMPLLFAAALWDPGHAASFLAVPGSPGNAPGSPGNAAGSARGNAGGSALPIRRFLPAPPHARQILRIAAPIALIWLTNAPAAVMGCYALALLTLVRLALPAGELAGASRGYPAKARLAVTTLAGTALGLLLPAFYLLPAAYERRFISSDMAVIAGMRPVDNTLFHHMLPATDDTLFHDQVLHSASLIAVTLLAGIALCAAGLWLLSGKRHSRPLAAIVPPLLLTAAVAFLLTPASLPVWNGTPELPFLQFPWRLCALLAPVLALLLALLLSEVFPLVETSLSLRPGGARAPGLPLLLAPIVLAAFLITPAWRSFHQVCDVEDTVGARVALFHSPLGTEPTDEYTPANADADKLQPHDPPWWLIPCGTTCTAETSPDAPAPAGAAPGQAPSHLVLSLPAPAVLVLNRRAYPAWRITRNGQPVPDALLPQRDDGLIALVLPAGASTVDLRLVHTDDRTFGYMLTLIGVIVAAELGTLSLGRRKQAHP